MPPSSKPDPKRASLTLYLIIALNAETKLERTINKVGAAQVLADLLQIDQRAPMSWLRGDFAKHPLSRENFLRFVRAYRTKPGLETSKEITELAINIYGLNYKRVIELLDPEDRESIISQDVMPILPGEEGVVAAIYKLLESSPEAIEVALGTMNTYQWSADVLLENLLGIPGNIEFGTGKIIQVVLRQLPNELVQAFSKLGGLPDLTLYNLACFEALLEKTGKELTEIVKQFESLNLIWIVKENEWKIKSQVLDIARQYLGELPKNTQQQTRLWWRRFLDKPKHLEAFRAHLFSKQVELTKEVNVSLKQKRQNKNHISFLERISRWTFTKVDEEWEYMEALSRFMSYDKFLFAKFLLIRRKRNLMLGLFISLWLGVTPLLPRIPLVVGCVVSVGVYAFFQLMMDFHRCDASWADLWGTLLISARSAQGDG